MVDGIELRMPYNSDPIAREKINFGKMEYFDFHLGSLAQYVRCGFFGDLDTAIIEVTGITEDGRLIPSTSVGNNQVFIDSAREVILEVNCYHPLELEGMHDVYEPDLPPNVQPIMILEPSESWRRTIRTGPRRSRSRMRTARRSPLTSSISSNTG